MDALLVGMTLVIAFGQLYNVERIEIENEEGHKYELLVGNMTHYKVVPNPIEGNKDFILEQKNNLDVLKNTKTKAKGDKTLPKLSDKFVKITTIGNPSVLHQIEAIFSLTAPRLLMPILIQRKKGDPHYLNSDD